MPSSESGVERQHVLSKRAPPPVGLKLTKHNLKLKKLELLM